MDYKELLRKYIKHVSDCTGSDLLYYGSDLTDKEIEELYRLAGEENDQGKT